MSFIYAEKSKNKEDNRTVIFSDTKTKLIGAYKSNWSEKTRKAIEKYGFAKCINVSPKFAMAFAGNNTAYAHHLLQWLYDHKSFTDEMAVDKAYNIHMSTSKDDIEFILCYADENNETHIVCIKEREIQQDVSSAWIGSYDAFLKLQEARTTSETSLEHFKNAIENCKDDSVGGLVICDRYYDNQQQFMFSERLEASADRIQRAHSGRIIKFSRPAETGDCTIHYISDPNDVIIQFYQNNTTILYTNRYRYSEEDVNNDLTNHFLLPMIIDFETGMLI